MGGATIKAPQLKIMRTREDDIIELCEAVIECQLTDAGDLGNMCVFCYATGYPDVNHTLDCATHIAKDLLAGQSPPHKNNTGTT